MDEKIDILMATYNGEKYIEEQINSILNQTYTNFRLVICDDCSTDNTYKLLKKIASDDDRIVIYKNEKNLGYIKNFEKLLGMVESEYFMLSDQDDIWYETRIEESFSILKKENADLVFTDLEVVDEELNTKNISFNKLMGYYKKILKCTDYNMVYLYNIVTGCTILSKSKYLSNILPLPDNKNLIHDHYIPLVISLYGGKIKYLNKPTIKYRQHTNNQVGTDRYTAKLKSFDEIRNHLVDVKISIFSEYVSINNFFNDNVKKLNKEALEYFNNLKSIKVINLKGIKTYFKLYKYEKVSYKMLYMFIFHFPIICKMLYKLAKVFIKKRR